MLQIEILGGGRQLNLWEEVLGDGEAEVFQWFFKFFAISTCSNKIENKLYA